MKYTIANFDETHIDKSVILMLIQRHQAEVSRISRLEQYYNGDHAINNRTRAYSNAPNNKVSVNFAKYITDVSTGYFISSPITYRSSTGEDLTPLIKAFEAAHTDDTDADNAFEASMNGESYEYVYVREGETELNVKNLCAKNTFMICDTTIEENEVAGVYYRSIHDDSTGETNYVATVVTQHYIYELNIFNNGHQTPTEAPREHYFGDVPIIHYKNNHNTIGDYEQTIPLIDAYNMTMSDRVNNVAEFVDSILIIYGTILADDNGDGLSPVQRLKESGGGMIEFPDKQTMGAEWLTRQLDESGVEVLQNSISKDILRMSYVPDFTDENFAGNASGVAIAFKCLLLEWLTKTKERYYKKGLRKRIRLFCNFLALKQINIDPETVVPHFTRALPVNQSEIANMLASLDGIVSRRTLLAQLPFVENPDAEVEAVNAEKEENLKRQQALFSMRPNTPPEEEEENAASGEEDATDGGDS